MANPEHLKILEQGVEVWNRWRTRNRSVKPDLSSANLSGNDLTRIDLIRAELDGADVSRAKLAEADLRRTDLYKADVRGTDLTCANLSRAYCSRADFSEANFREAKLEETSLIEACLRRADLSDTHLRWAKLESADLSYANLTGAYLTGAYLTGAHLSHARLEGADLTGANLSQANLTGANLTGANLTDATLFRADVRANLRGADLRRADLCGANLSHTDLNDTILHGAFLAGTDLSHCRVELDLVWIGEALDVLRNESFKDVRWKRVFVGPLGDFDPSSYKETSQYWITRKSNESLLGRIHQYIADNLGIADDITIEFSVRVWRELHLVEIGLGEALGHDAVTFEKDVNRLSVTFKSRDDVQRGIEYLLIQMSALEAAEQERVQRLTMRLPEGELIVKEGKEIKQLLTDIQRQIRTVGEQISERSTPAEDAVVDSVGSLPVLGPLVKPFAKKTLDNPRVRAWARMDVGAMWKRFFAGFRWIREEKERMEDRNGK